MRSDGVVAGYKVRSRLSAALAQELRLQSWRVLAGTQSGLDKML